MKKGGIESRTDPCFGSNIHSFHVPFAVAAMEPYSEQRTEMGGTKDL